MSSLFFEKCSVATHKYNTLRIENSHGNTMGHTFLSAVLAFYIAGFLL